MTTIKVVVERDADGRLQGTIEHDRPGSTVVGFSGVIEMVAHIEASLDQPEGADERAAGPRRSGPPTTAGSS